MVGTNLPAGAQALWAGGELSYPNSPVPRRHGPAARRGKPPAQVNQ
jgi:hypothetical protein